MKKVLFCSILVFSLGLNNTALAHYCYNHSYLVHRDYYEEEFNFANCDKHYVIEGTSTYYYSNGTRSRYTSSTIYNSDGTIIEANCRNVKHYIHNNKHYFSFYKNKKYNIISEDRSFTSVKKYKSIEEIAPGKLLVKLNKKYGIIDLNENEIVPIKYKSFKTIGESLYLTNLNGYYGMINVSNKTLIKNEYDKIKEIHNAYLLKGKNGYGLADKNGKIIVTANCDNIKKLGEYIVVEQGNRFGVFDSNANSICPIIYKKIRLERNSLEGNLNKEWVKLIPDE